MKTNLPARKLREHPDLDQLKRQAKELLEAFGAGDADAVTEVNQYYCGADRKQFALHDAQLVLARSHGFDSWPKLKAYVDGATVKRLAEAVQSGDAAQVRAMLKVRPELVNMEMSYSDERRALHFAVLGRAPEMVRLLMQHGADARKGVYPHRDVTTALTIATERGYDEIVAIIQEEEQHRREADTALPSAPKQDERSEAISGAELTARSAVAAGDVDWLRARHAQGALVNPIRWGSGGLLTVAVEHDRPDILAMLLDFGFDPDERVRWGGADSTWYSQGFPLWQCAAQGKREMAEILLQRGANPNVHVDSSGSSVYSAYSHRQWGMVELLRRYGGIVGADTAALYRETELARQMLAMGDGPFPEGMVAQGKTLAEELLEFGASGGDPEIVRMALERIDWPREDPRWFWTLGKPLGFWNHIPWLYAGNPELDRGTYILCFRLILERCSPNLIGRFGRTILHEVAALDDHVTEEEGAPFAAALLDAGARLDVRDDWLRSTPLGWACRWGRIEVVRALIERGADPVEADADSWATPRAWAEKMGHSEVLAMLVDSQHGGKG